MEKREGEVNSSSSQRRRIRGKIVGVDVVADERRIADEFEELRQRRSRFGSVLHLSPGDAGEPLDFG